MEEYAIIVAGGGGTRMQSKIPKQFLLLANKPILMHSIEAFIHYSAAVTIILVLPEKSIVEWELLCEKHAFRHLHITVRGGETRFESVKNGLESIKNENSLVAIHDGVRPLVDTEIISNSFRTAEIYGSAIASALLKESIVKTNGEKLQSVDRENYRSIQTPQTFKTELIKAAYRNTQSNPSFTDDSSVAANYGIPIKLISGNYRNIKVTTPEDLVIAEALLR